MKKFFRIALWTIVALIFVGTFVYLYKNSQDKPTVYETVRPHIGTIERTTLLTGKIEPRDEIDIKPQISGIIAEIRGKPAFGRRKPCRGRPSQSRASGEQI